jgi:hypothetical protein
VVWRLGHTVSLGSLHFFQWVQHFFSQRTWTQGYRFHRLLWNKFCTWNM